MNETIAWLGQHWPLLTVIALVVICIAAIVGSIMSSASSAPDEYER